MKIIGLLSGGLDSTLAVQMMVNEGYEVIALKFTSPFCQCDSGGCCHAAQQAQRMGIPLKMISKGADYLEVIRHPAHGRGAGMNPCIDCRIFMLRKAKLYMDEIGAAFMFTGEVVGQRPMSQQRRTLDLIEREAGLAGQILRPLSAQHLPPTEAEQKGWVDREKLLAIEGRSRKPQIALAKEFGIDEYACPAGGCLLTDKSFSAKLRDLFAFEQSVTLADMGLLKVGRHFRSGAAKIVCGRNQSENETLRALRRPEDSIFESGSGPGPTVLLRGAATEDAVRLAGDVAAAYSDAATERVRVRHESAAGTAEIEVARVTRESLQARRIG